MARKCFFQTKWTINADELIILLNSVERAICTKIYMGGLGFGRLRVGWVSLNFVFKASRKSKIQNFPTAPAIVAPTRNTSIYYFFGPFIFSEGPGK